MQEVKLINRKHNIQGTLNLLTLSMCTQNERQCDATCVLHSDEKHGIRERKQQDLDFRMHGLHLVFDSH